MKIRIYIVSLFIMTLGCKPKLANIEPTKQRPNILFIAIDDLRPELGCYGSDMAISPNIDALAANGLLFNNAYCQEAICSPSRASLMTGARPESIQVIENFTYFREQNTGKIYHNKEFGDGKLSWSRKPVEIDNPKGNFGFKLPENQKMQKENAAAMVAKYGENALRNGLGKGPAYEFADFSDNEYEDGHNTDLAIATMKDMLEKNPDKPFFLGLGMKKPHLDWVAPKKYWDLYDQEKIKLAEHEEAPKDGATMGLHASFELRAGLIFPKKAPLIKNLQLT